MRGLGIAFAAHARLAYPLPLEMATHTAPRRDREGDARARAVEVLVRVEVDGAYAAAALRATLERGGASLSPAERGLATELVYGVLRTAPVLDQRLQKYAQRADSIAKLDAYTRAVLRVAAYQILALARVPARAAVHEAVESIKRNRSPGSAGFANAVLRKLAAERPEVLPENVRVELAVDALPPWVVAALAEVLGGEGEARAAMRAAFERAGETALRVNARKGSREDLASRVRAESEGAEAREGRVSPLAVIVSGAGDVSKSAAYREGAFAVQEEGAQCVALASGARAGMSVLDVCAGRGGKTGALAGMMEGRGTLHAVELYPEKIARIAPELARLGLAGAELAFEGFAVDLTRGIGALAKRAPREGYDVVVVDAPCSGLGTLARRPEMLLRGPRAGALAPTTSEDEGAPVAVASGAGKTAKATKAASAGAGTAGATGATGGEASARMELSALQRAIMERVAPLVKAGGTLVYAVCTLSRAEGDGVVEAFCAAHPEFAVAEATAAEGVPERLRAGRVVLRPDADGTDGFMVFRLRRSVGA